MNPICMHSLERITHLIYVINYHLNKSIPLILPNIPQSQTPIELPNEAPAIVERIQEAPTYVRTTTTEHFPSFVGQQKLNNRHSKPTFRTDEDDVFLHNQYNLLSPDVLERIPTKTSLTKTNSSVSTSLHGSIAHTPPLSPNGDTLIPNVGLNLPLPPVQGSFLQTPPETPLSIVYQYRNSKVKVPSEPVTPIQQVANTSQNSNYFSLPTLNLVPNSRTYPSIPQTDFAQNAFPQPQTKLKRAAAKPAETVKEIKRQLSEDEADELIAHVETYLSGTDALDGDKDYIIMVKKSSDGTTGDNIVICREVDSAKSEDSNKGAIKKQLQISYSDPTFKETSTSMSREKLRKTYTERSLSQIAGNVQKFKHIPLVQSNSAHSCYRLHKTKEIDRSIEEENDQIRIKPAQTNQGENVILLNKLNHDPVHREECHLKEEETSAILKIKIVESDNVLTPSSEDNDGRTRNESVFPGYFPVYNEWSSSTDEIKLDSEGI